MDANYKHRNTDQSVTINWRCWRKECKARVRTNNFNPENLEDANAIRVLFHEQHAHESADEKMINRAVFTGNHASRRDGQPCPSRKSNRELKWRH
jgi:hypothetical protein